MTRESLIRLRKSNIEFYTNIIIELGLLRLRNECAICFKPINIKNYHIQLCKSCRLIEMERRKAPEEKG